MPYILGLQVVIEPYLGIVGLQIVKELYLGVVGLQVVKEPCLTYEDSRL
jgi:hypothetical protein